MGFLQLKTLRQFIFLLITIFIINTVYASGMMLAGEMSVNHTAKNMIHNHDHHDMTQHDYENHDAGQKQTTNHNCYKCGHCIACFSVLPQSQLNKIQSQSFTSTVRLFEPTYLSHISAQPQRPPIS